MARSRSRRRNNKLTTLAALASAVQLVRLPNASVSLSPIISAGGRCRSGSGGCCSTSSSSSSARQRSCGGQAAHSCTGAAARSASSSRLDLSCNRGPRLPCASSSWGGHSLIPWSSSPNGGVGSSCGTALSAFWTRSTDPEGTDETKRSSNSLWRRILPGRGGGEGAGGGGTAAQEGSKQKRTTGRRPGSASAGQGGGSNRSRTKSSSARYYYSAALVSEQCPSFPQSTEECSITDSVYDMYDPPPSSSSTLDGDDQNQRQKKKQNRNRRLVESGLDNFIHRHALHTLNLKIKSDASRNLQRVLLRGDVGSVHASFDRLAFPALKLSGGGKLSAVGLNLNTASFVPPLGRLLASRRFKDPFEFRAQDCVLTAEDIETSVCIRNGLAALGTRILRHVVSRDTSLDVVRIDRGATVHVHGVEVLETNMLCCTGIITTILGSVIPFEVKTGLRVSSIDGHVLRFPGLEVTLNPNSALMVKMPLHVLLPVDLDIGDNAFVENVEIDGRRKSIRLSMKATVTPARSKRTKEEGQVVGYRKERSGTAAAAARYSCDIGNWLTKLARL